MSHTAKSGRGRRGRGAGGFNNRDKRENQGKNKQALVKTVCEATSWPEEDVSRVLEEYNWDPEQAVDGILAGIHGQPQSDWVRVPTKKERSQRREESSDFSQSSRGSSGTRGRGRGRGRGENRDNSSRGNSGRGRSPRPTNTPAPVAQPAEGSEETPTQWGAEPTNPSTTSWGDEAEAASAGSGWGSSTDGAAPEPAQKAEAAGGSGWDDSPVANTQPKAETGNAWSNGAPSWAQAAAAQPAAPKRAPTQAKAVAAPSKQAPAEPQFQNTAETPAPSGWDNKKPEEPEPEPQQPAEPQQQSSQGTILQQTPAPAEASSPSEPTEAVMMPESSLAEVDPKLQFSFNKMTIKDQQAEGQQQPPQQGNNGSILNDILPQQQGGEMQMGEHVNPMAGPMPGDMGMGYYPPFMMPFGPQVPFDAERMPFYPDPNHMAQAMAQGEPGKQGKEDQQGQGGQQGQPGAQGPPGAPMPYGYPMYPYPPYYGLGQFPGQANQFMPQMYKQPFGYPPNPAGPGSGGYPEDIQGGAMPPFFMGPPAPGSPNMPPPGQHAEGRQDGQPGQFEGAPGDFAFSQQPFPPFMLQPQFAAPPGQAQPPTQNQQQGQRGNR